MAPATPRSEIPDEARPYHHGHLREALIDAAYAQAREGGRDAVSLREATREAGVTARAAYRHFDGLEGLTVAVSLRAMADMATVIDDRQAALPASGPLEDARARLRAVGEGYIQFALDEPGSFDIAFFGMATMEHAEDPAAAAATGRTPYQQLLDALGGLAAAGALPADAVPVAATFCWSVVHGFATLATKGPIRDLPRPSLDAMAAALVAGTVSSLETNAAALSEPR